MASIDTNIRLGHCLVLGLGTTGTAAARLLASLMPESVYSVSVVGGLESSENSATRELEELGVKLHLGSETIEGSYDLCVASPGISELSSFFLTAKAHSREIISEPELVWRLSPNHWIGITGTNGKTTVTSLITHIMNKAGIRAEAVGNIGTSVSERVLERDKNSWFVAELSSFQLASSVSLHPRIACLTNIAPDHLEWHGSFENYWKAKEKIFASLGPEDLAVVSEMDPISASIADRLDVRGLRVCRVSTKRKPTAYYAAFVEKGKLAVRFQDKTVYLSNIQDLAIKGEHNVANALFAASVGLELGIDPSSLMDALESFAPLEHRIEPCGKWAGVSFVNDSKATNPDSTIAALTAFEKGQAIILLGGHDKGTDLTDLAHAVCTQAKAAVCYGEAGARIQRALYTEDPDFALFCELHMADAFKRATELAEEGDSVLLSPACSSFDEFTNYAERGQSFKALVAKLKESADSDG